MRHVASFFLLLTLFALGCGHGQKPKPTAPAAPDAGPPTITIYDFNDHWRVIPAGTIDLPKNALGAYLHVSHGGTLFVSLPFQLPEGIRSIDVLNDAAAELKADSNVVLKQGPLTLHDGRTALLTFDMHSQPDMTMAMVIRETQPSSGRFVLCAGTFTAEEGDYLLGEMLDAAVFIGNHIY